MLGNPFAPAQCVADVFIPSIMNWQEQSRTHPYRWRTTDDPIARKRRILLDVAETKNCIEVQADIPGVSKSEIKASIEDGVMSIEVSQDKKSKTSSKKDNEGVAVTWHRHERPRRYLKRSLRLPEIADTTEPKTTYLDGVLTVTFPKKETSRKARRLSIE